MACGGIIQIPFGNFVVTFKKILELKPLKVTKLVLYR